MDLWIAMGTVDYEGGTILGVFSTEEEADRVCYKHRFNHDRVFSSRVTLNEEEYIDV